MTKRLWTVVIILCIFLPVTVSPVAGETFERQDLLLPQLPSCTDEPDASVCEVERDWDAGQIEARLDADGKAVWTEGDLWLVAYQAKADSVFLNGGIQTLLRPLPEGDLWVLAARVQNLPEAAIGYAFLAFVNGAPDFLAQTFYSWRGPDAPPEPAHADPLAGTLTTYALESDSLDNPRAVTVYLPPNHDPAQPAPVVYLADGQMLAGFAPYIEPLIVDGTLPPVILVGIHASQSPLRSGDDPRAAEYLDGYSHDGRFEKHEQFFIDDVMPWAEKTFGASDDPDQRVIFGASNGAAFALSIKHRHPLQIGSVIAFSVAGAEPAYSNVPAGRYYLVAGTLEPAHERTVLWADVLTSAQTEVVFRDRVGGHDNLIWHEELPLAIRWVFAGSQ